MDEKDLNIKTVEGVEIHKLVPDATYMRLVGILIKLAGNTKNSPTQNKEK